MFFSYQDPVVPQSYVLISWLLVSCAPALVFLIIASWIVNLVYRDPHGVLHPDECPIYVKTGEVKFGGKRVLWYACTSDEEFYSREKIPASREHSYHELPSSPTLEEWFELNGERVKVRICLRAKEGIDLIGLFRLFKSEREVADAANGVVRERLSQVYKTEECLAPEGESLCDKSVFQRKMISLGDILPIDGLGAFYLLTDLEVVDFSLLPSGDK